MTVHQPITIVGAGLGGLTTARVLRVHGIAATVFESEPSRQSRVQGGMLDIHAENGQEAVRAAGLLDEFQGIVHPGGEAMRILDSRGAVRLEQHDDGSMARPEVDRGQLRDLLIDALPEDTIRWGRKVVGVRPLRGAVGRFEVEFADGELVTTDLLIGADGAWSRVRPIVSDAQPANTGISFVEVDLFDADERHPEQSAVMGSGMLFALGGASGILGHRETDGSLHVYLGHRADEGWIDTIDFSDTAAAKSAVLALLDGWDDDLRGLIADADTGLTPRRIYALPTSHSWGRVAGVTLLGDAAHLMSPFAGEGANLAMYDGAQLALAIAAHPSDHEAALTAYEEELFPRSAAAAAESAASLEIIFSEDAPRGLLEMFASFDGAETAAVVERLTPYAAAS